MKQSSRSCNIRFDNTIRSYRFVHNIDKSCVYKKIVNATVAFLVLYVDDILLIRNYIGYLTNTKKWLATQFQMKDLREAQYFLEIQIFEIIGTEH